MEELRSGCTLTPLRLEQHRLAGLAISYSNAWQGGARLILAIRGIETMPGVIDPPWSNTDLRIYKGDRVAQLVVEKIMELRVSGASELNQKICRGSRQLSVRGEEACPLAEPNDPLYQYIQGAGNVEPGVSYQSVPQKYPTRVSHKSVRQECPTRVSRKSAIQECPTRASYKLFFKSVPQECPKRVTNKSAPQECPKECPTRVPKECPTRVSRKTAYKSAPQ